MLTTDHVNVLSSYFERRWSDDAPIPHTPRSRPTLDEDRPAPKQARDAAFGSLNQLFFDNKPVSPLPLPHPTSELASYPCRRGGAAAAGLKARGLTKPLSLPQLPPPDARLQWEHTVEVKETIPYMAILDLLTAECSVLAKELGAVAINKTAAALGAFAGRLPITTPGEFTISADFVKAGEPLNRKTVPFCHIKIDCVLKEGKQCLEFRVYGVTKEDMKARAAVSAVRNPEDRFEEMTKFIREKIDFRHHVKRSAKKTSTNLDELHPRRWLQFEKFNDPTDAWGQVNRLYSRQLTRLGHANPTVECFWPFHTILPSYFLYLHPSADDQRMVPFALVLVKLRGECDTSQVRQIQCSDYARAPRCDPRLLWDGVIGCSYHDPHEDFSDTLAHLFPSILRSARSREKTLGPITHLYYDEWKGYEGRPVRRFSFQFTPKANRATRSYIVNFTCRSDRRIQMTIRHFSEAARNREVDAALASVLSSLSTQEEEMQALVGDNE